MIDQRDDETAQANLAKIEPRLDWLDRWMRQHTDLLQADPETVFPILCETAEKIVASVWPDCACTFGCSHCCYQAVFVTETEARAISKFIGKPYSRPREKTNVENGHLIVDTIRARFTGVPCCFLQDGLCSVYDVRPIACRTHFNISSNRDLCDIINHPGREVPNIDLWVFSSFLPVASSPGVYGDIREFFAEATNGGGDKIL